MKKQCFTTIKNYNTLKLAVLLKSLLHGFTTIKNYNTLKLRTLAARRRCSFTTIKNYNTLKQLSRLQQLTP